MDPSPSVLFSFRQALQLDESTVELRYLLSEADGVVLSDVGFNTRHEGRLQVR